MDRKVLTIEGLSSHGELLPDSKLKVTGEAIYTADVEMRGRVYARCKAHFAPGGI